LTKAKVSWSSRISRRPSRRQGIAAPYRQDRPHVQHQRSEPGTGVSKYDARFVQQLFGAPGVTAAEHGQSHPAQRIAGAPWDAEAPEARDAARESLAGGAAVSLALINVREHELRVDGD
jgi:hypothetical protein